LVKKSVKPTKKVTKNLRKAGPEKHIKCK